MRSRTTISPELVAGVASKLASRRSERVPSEEKTPEEPRPYHQAAAVLATFDPVTLKPVGAATPEAIVQIAAADANSARLNISPFDALLADSVQQQQSDRTSARWILDPDVRISVLRELRRTNRVAAALAANEPQPSDPTDRALRAYLSGTAPPIQQLTLEDLSATRTVTEWLRAAGFSGLPTRAEIVARCDWIGLLQPFQHIAGEHFGGRTQEMQVLREYADVLPPQTVLGGARAFVKRAFNWTHKRPLVIFGPGGVGKSTLVARFILEHATALETGDRFPFVYIDFDRAEVAFNEPLTVLVEAVRQLGIEYPEARERCEALRRAWLEPFTPRGPSEPPSTPSLAVSNQSPEQMARHLASAVRDFITMVGSLGAGDRPVLFVLDTFEEVQRRSEAYVSGIWRLVEQLQAGLPRIRAVFVGRADLPGRSTEMLPLHGLDPEAAAAFLRARGIANADAAARLARQVGGSPLSLKLAAEVASQGGLDASGQIDITTREYLFMRVDDALIQRQLYRRILGHVRDPDVRKLAHPGLVLRRLTPDIILRVLKGPCGLDTIQTIEAATDLFRRLRKEVSLVTIVDDQTVRHRQDLRVLMLELLRADEPERTAAIDKAAVAYYAEHSTSPLDRAEEVYHRLWLNQPFEDINRRWLPGVEPYLSQSLDEFSGARRAYIASRIGIEVDEDTRRQAELEDWERLIERKASELLTQDQPAEALNLLRGRTARSVASPLPLLEARALSRLDRADEALAVLDGAIKASASHSHREQALALATAAVKIVVRFRRTELAAQRRVQVKQFERSSMSPTAQLEIVVPMLALAKIDAGAANERGILEAQLEKLIDDLSDETLRERPELVAWAGTLLGSPKRLARVLRQTVPGAVPAGALRHAASELTQFDVRVSKDLGETPGALAREHKIPQAATVTQTWSDFLVKTPVAQTRLMLATILEAEAVFVPATLVDAIGRLLHRAAGIEDARPAAAPAQPAQAAAPSSVRLDAKTRDDLSQALANAFVSTPQLEELLLLRLDRNLAAITAPGPLPSMTLEVVAAADQQGWVTDLVTAAVEARPANALLADVATRLGISSLGGNTAGIEPSQFFDIGTWRERIAVVEGQVCRVEIGDRPVGTGFLVGVDLVLTADFVLDDVHAKKGPSSAVRLRFDYKADAGGHTISAGTLFQLQHEWLVARRPWSTAPDGLGYVILRVGNSPGAQPLGRATRESQATLRQWIEVPPSPRIPAPKDGIIIVQHPRGGPLKLVIDPSGVRGTSPNGKLVYYSAHAESGSSGSPCFDSNFNLVAMHIGSGPVDEHAPPDSNVGVLMAAIVRDLASQGLLGLLATKFL